MSFGGDWSSWFTGILMALTVTVGLLGIFQDRHRKDGKLTRVGWGLVAAIVLLGALTFLSGLRDQRIAEEKERADAAERGRQFQSQMAALRGVTGSLSRLQTAMRATLWNTHETHHLAYENLRMGASVQQQEQANTLAVLRRVFEESNRVAAERIAIGVTYRCPQGDSLFTDSPTIRQATLTVRSGASSDISLSTAQVTQLSDGIIFNGFLGDLRNFETFPAWRTARISIRLSGGDDRLGVSLDNLVNLTEEERRRAENREAVSCPATAMLLLNGRQVLSGAANFTRRGAHGYRGYAADFENLRVDTRRLPRF